MRSFLFHLGIASGAVTCESTAKECRFVPSLALSLSFSLYFCHFSFVALFPARISLGNASTIHIHLNDTYNHIMSRPFGRAQNKNPHIPLGGEKPRENEMELKHSVRHSMELNCYHTIQNHFIFKSHHLAIACIRRAKNASHWLPRVSSSHVTVSSLNCRQYTIPTQFRCFFSKGKR